MSLTLSSQRSEVILSPEEQPEIHLGSSEVVYTRLTSSASGSNFIFGSGYRFTSRDELITAGALDVYVTYISIDVSTLPIGKYYLNAFFVDGSGASSEVTSRIMLDATTIYTIAHGNTFVTDATIANSLQKQIEITAPASLLSLEFARTLGPLAAEMYQANMTLWRIS